MAAVGNEDIYVGMMVDSLHRKESVLGSLYDLTQKQEKLLWADELDADAFGRTLEEKGARIEELNGLDDGFDRIYQKIETVLKEHPDAHAASIRMMRESIRNITDLSTRIQTLEKKNKDRFQKYITEQKSEVRRVNMNQRTASTYAQNMAGAHKAENSYFFNETK